jgi:hypothetical protein
MRCTARNNGLAFSSLPPPHLSSFKPSEILLYLYVVVDQHACSSLVDWVAKGGQVGTRRGGYRVCCAGADAVMYVVPLILLSLMLCFFLPTCDVEMRLQ